jgi:hypothetical protein
VHQRYYDTTTRPFGLFKPQVRPFSSHNTRHSQGCHEIRYLLDVFVSYVTKLGWKSGRHVRNIKDWRVLVRLFRTFSFAINKHRDFQVHIFFRLVVYDAPDCISVLQGLDAQFHHCWPRPSQDI